MYYTHFAKNVQSYWAHSLVVRKRRVGLLWWRAAKEGKGCKWKTGHTGSQSEKEQGAKEQTLHSVQCPQCPHHVHWAPASFYTKMGFFGNFFPNGRTLLLLLELWPDFTLYVCLFWPCYRKKVLGWEDPPCPLAFGKNSQMILFSFLSSPKSLMVMMVLSCAQGRRRVVWSTLHFLSLSPLLHTIIDTISNSPFPCFSKDKRQS